MILNSLILNSIKNEKISDYYIYSKMVFVVINYAFACPDDFRHIAGSEYSSS